MPSSVKITNFLRDTLRKDTSTYILCLPLEQSLARTKGWQPEVILEPDLARLVLYHFEL